MNIFQNFSAALFVINADEREFLFSALKQTSAVTLEVEMISISIFIANIFAFYVFQFIMFIS